ncbi:MAG: sialidase family protein [Chloroflexota bacterium]
MAALAIGLALIGVGPAAAATWSAPTSLDVSGNDGTSAESDLTAASGNVVNVLLWNDQSVARIRSTDAGASWSGFTVLGQKTGTATFRPEGLASSGARVLVLYSSSDGDVRTLLLRVSTDGGATFGSPITLASYTDHAARMGFGSVAVSGTRAIAAWTDVRTGKVLARRSTDGGVSWKTATQLGITVRPWDGGADGHVEVALAGSKAYAAWQPGKSDTDAKGIVVRRSLDSGASWKPIVTLTTRTTHINGPAIAASGSTVLVLYTETSGATTLPKIARSTDSGASFSRSAVPVAGFWGFDVTIVGSQARVTFMDLHDMSLRSSSDRGKTWAATESLGKGSDPNVTIAPAATTVVLTRYGDGPADMYSIRRT